MRNFYVFVLMLLIGAWANVTQVAAQDATSAVTKAVRVTALDQLATGSKIVIRNAGGSDRDGYVHESDGKLLINHGASSFQNLTDDYVFTLVDYSSTDGTCYLTAKSGNKVSGTGEPMTTVASPEGKITLVVEGTDRWDLKYGNGNWFNTQSNATYGPFVNTWTAQGDPNATWEIYMVVDDATFMPEEGQAYYIDCLKSGNGRAVYLPGMNILGISGDSDVLHWGNLFTISIVLSSGEVRYQIKSYANPDAYVYYVNTNSADENVGITTNASHANLNWKITKSTATDVDGYNIIPSTGSNGWNCRGSVSSPWWGSKTAIGQWNDNTKADNTWGFVAVNETGVTAAVQTYKTTIQPPCGTVGCCTQEEYTNAYNQLTEQKDLFMAPWSIPSQSTMIKPSNASGLYKIKNKQLNKYLFQNDEQKNIAFINDRGDNTKYYYRVTFDGNQATIINSNAKPLARGNQGATYANATTVVASPVTLTYCGGNGYFLFPNTHSTAQNNFTQNNAAYNTDTNPYFLTTWTSVEAANQYTFEEVTIPEGSYVYGVQFEGLKGLSGDDALTVTYNGTNYEGNTKVGNGGFYVFSTTPQVSDFKASDDENYGNGTVTIDEENHLVKVSFVAKKAILALQVTMDGVKYHEASMEAPIGQSYQYDNLFGYYKWLLTTNATLTVNGVEKAISDVFTDGSIIPTENTTYIFALKTTEILAKEKLYQISSAITTPLTSQNGRGGKKMYGKPGMIYTKYVGDDLATERFLAMAHSLWKFEYTDETQGFFKIYNQVTGQYMGPVVNNTTNVVFTDAAGAGIYKLIPASALHQNVGSTTEDMTAAMYSGALFKIAASDATAEMGDRKKLHIQNSGNNQLIGYDDEEIWSKWYFTASTVDITKVDNVKSIEGRLLDQTRITPSTMVDMKNMTYSTNAQKVDAGLLQQNGVWVLKDGDPSTYFHTKNGADVGEYHWLQVDLGEGNNISSFSFYTRKKDNSQRPTEIEVQVSEDNATFYYLYTLYGIPTTNDDFYSPSYPLNNAKDVNGNEVSITSPRYLRFIVKATNTGDTYGNTDYPYFTFSEFHIQTTTGVLPNALAEVSLAQGKAAIDAVCQPYDEATNYNTISNELYNARNNALNYVAAHTALKAKVGKLAKLGNNVHEYSVAEGSSLPANIEEVKANIENVNSELINTTAKCENLNSAIQLTLNSPTFGQVYRLKSKQFASESNAANYVGTGGQMEGDRLALSGVPSAGNEKDLLLLYTSDKKLVSPITGAELTVYNLSHFDFSEHRSEDGTYRVATFNPDNASDENARILYANEGGTYGKIDYSQIGGNHETVTNTSWYLEPVKSYPVTMNVVGDERWATFYSDNNVFLPDGVKARYMTGSESDMQQTETSGVYKLTYTPIAEDDHLLPGGTGVWLVEENADGTAFTDPAKLRFCVSEYCTPATTTPGNSNWFVGKETADGQISASVLYALGKPSGYAAGFYRWKGEVSAAPANKAYLTIPSSANSLNAYGFIFVDGDDATGIEAIQPAAVGEEDGVCYDLTGKRVVNPTRPGIYIKNGKKLVIK
ncbi:MAG: discoidin domain-containing protein [Paraprevotella sp.]|nr:discoidin domain-containing protein [Paraprevotella sp.]